MESFITSAAILAVAAAGAVPLGNQVEVLLPESDFATTAKLVSFHGKIESEVFGDETKMTMTYKIFGTFPAQTACKLKHLTRFKHEHSF